MIDSNKKRSTFYRRQTIFQVFKRSNQNKKIKQMKRTTINLFLCIVLVFISLGSAFGQSKVVKGKVTDQNGKALEGVTVSVKQTNRATSTEADGSFSISASPGDILLFTFVGFQSREEILGNANYVEITLIQKLSDLDEVVVVGYGTQKKGNLTGAVSTIDVDKSLHGRPIADVGRGLQGAASGLSVTIPSGEVGSDPIIKIRGQITSFRGATSPLILLDNVEIPSIQIVNPNDIASITVLKDAAAASIYGAKASNGVILITTKKGSGTAKPQINYSDNFSWQNIWKDVKMGDVNALRYTVDAAERVGTTTPVGAFYYVDKASYLKAVEWKNKYGSTIGPNDPTVFGRDWYVQGATNQKMGVILYSHSD